ncbi:MAG: T9SS type A sorting domain-containing protein, partial [Flavobacteriales bacterium]|nr:T9SS type A sorting domain-containing protein [Flavobacteriales bacterium]
AASNNVATHTLTNSAGCDSLVTLDLTILNNNTGTDVQMGCDSYVWIDGNTYTVSNNVATHTLTNAVGCDSVVTLDLVITNGTAATDIQSACGSYSWIDGNTYTVSNNTATHLLTNVAGCDSIITLDLTINNSNTGIDVQIACNTYTWIDGNTYTVSNNTATHTLTNVAGCDSTVTLDLTISSTVTGTDIQTACDSYTWIDGNTYTANNSTATHLLTAAAGCDSIVTLNLTINIVNVSVTSNDPSIMANAVGATYKWLDCNNGFSIIAGETAQNFTAVVNGDYAVEVTENSCTDTSTCVSISGVGIIENSFGNSLIVYPNPTSGHVTVDLGKIYSSINVRLLNVNGQSIRTKNIENSNMVHLEIDGAIGYYFIEIITTDNKKAVIKILKEH